MRAHTFFSLSFYDNLNSYEAFIIHSIHNPRVDPLPLCLHTTIFVQSSSSSVHLYFFVLQFIICAAFSFHHTQYSIEFNIISVYNVLRDSLHSITDWYIICNQRSFYPVSTMLLLAILDLVGLLLAATLISIKREKERDDAIDKTANGPSQYAIIYCV